MRMQYGLGFVLAVMLTVSGCCCPMTCSPMMSCAPMTCAPMTCAPFSCTPCCYAQPCCPQPSWTEKFEDAYWDLSDCVHHHGCHMQQSLSSSMKQLAANLTPEDNYAGENNYKQMPASAKVPPQSAPKEKKHRTCQRCKQSPCRCGHCEGCDGFEEADPNAPANTEVYQEQYPDQYYTPPPENAVPYQPQPVTPVPTPGPTPIFQNPPSAAPANPPPAPVTPPVNPPATPPATPPAAPAEPPPVPPAAEPVAPPAEPVTSETARTTRRTAPKSAPANSTSARTTTRVSARTTEPKATVTPIDVSIPEDEDLKLKPINFTTHAPLGKDGWEPVAAPK